MLWHLISYIFTVNALLVGDRAKLGTAELAHTVFGE